MCSKHEQLSQSWQLQTMSHVLQPQRCKFCHNSFLGNIVLIRPSLTGASTLYTGEYSSSVAKRTAAALDSRAPFGKARNPLLGKVLHRFGQSAFNDNQNAFAVDCLAQVTTYEISTSTIQDQTVTETVTAATPTIYITLRNKAVDDSEPVPITTTITAQPTDNVASGICTVTAASTTTTQHLKCAPTNLISQVDGYGIGETQGDSSNTRGLAPGSDPSACCQLCLDTDGCAASEDDPDAGNCFLWYTTPTCGLGFKYAAGSQELAAGAGFFVQTGCGTIEETDS